MAVEITLRFEDSYDADAFLHGVEHGHVDGHRLHQLKGVNALRVVGERVDLRDERL